MVPEARLASVRDCVADVHALTRVHLESRCIAALPGITVVDGKCDGEIRADDFGGAAHRAVIQANDTADLKLELLTAAADRHWTFVSLHKAGRDVRPAGAPSAKSVTGIAPMAA